MGHGALPAVIAGAFVFGIAGSFWAGIRKPLSGRSASDDSPWAEIGSAFTIALGPLMFIGGWIVDSTSARWVLVGSSLLLGTALFGFALSRVYARSLAAVVAATAGTASTGVATISLMPVAFLDDNVAASLNLGFVFVTLGALLGPPAASLLTGALGYERGLSIIAALALIPAGLTLLAGGSSFGSAGADHVESYRSLAAPVIWLASAVLVLYILVEGMIITWIVNHSSEFDTTKRHDDGSIWRLLGPFSRLAPCACIRARVLVTGKFRLMGAAPGRRFGGGDARQYGREPKSPEYSLGRVGPWDVSGADIADVDRASFSRV
jgi:hypothetical protein